MTPTTAPIDSPGRRAVGAAATARAVIDLMRIKNPWGTFLLLLPSMWALVLAGQGHPPLAIVVTFALGAFVMRSAGCVINDLADRNIDPLIARTKSRPLADGRLAPATAIAVFIALVTVAFVLILPLNRLAILLSGGGLLLAILYPFTKRFVAIPQAFLGMAFGWGTFMAWAAVTNTVSLTPLLLFAATVCWAIAYDTIYAIQDIDDDRRVGVRSSAILFGDAAWLWVTLFLLATAALLTAAGLREGLSGLFIGAVLIACGYFIYQGQRVKSGLSRPQAFRLFSSHVWVGAWLLTAMWLDTLI